MTSRSTDLSKHPAVAAAYSVLEAARVIGVPPATVRSWLHGQRYFVDGQARRFQPVIEIDDPTRRGVSFRNLIELHALASIRRNHRVTLPRVRRALRYLSKHFNDHHPLANRLVLTDGRDLLVSAFGKLFNASLSGQLEIEGIVNGFLKRVEHDVDGLPIRLYPAAADSGEDSAHPIALDPRIQFGRPCLAKRAIPTAEIAERFRAGEPATSLADDFGATPEEIEAAIRFEFRLAA